MTAVAGSHNIEEKKKTEPTENKYFKNPGSLKQISFHVFKLGVGEEVFKWQEEKLFRKASHGLNIVKS